MSILNKDEYLEKLKNKMLLHFSHQDIRTTLEDTSLLFDSGMVAGKTEAELCDEFGSPKELAHNLLLKKSSNSLRSISLCAQITICFILCLLVFHYPSLLFSIITIIIVPISIWHLEGGYCLFQIRSDTVKNYKIYSIFFTISIILISIQQIFTILLKNSVNISIPIIIATFYLSFIFILILIAILITSIYKLHKGYYLSYGILNISIGAICSSLLYIDYLKCFSPPVASYNICSLPFVISLLIGIFYYWNILKRKDKNLWIHK